MLAGLISYALLGALATALLVAAVTDLRRREIDNELNLAIALVAPLYWLSAGLDWVAVLFQLGLAVVTFVVACTLYAARQMGGGDVKLLSALALWIVPGSFLQLIVIMGVIGGAASIGMAVFNMRRVPHETLRNGLSTIVAALWVMGACAVIHAVVTGQPIVPPGTFAKLGAALPPALTQTLPQAWLLGAVSLVALGLFVLGLGHIFRRQRGSIPIPYGVAISAAGLWVVGQSMLPATLSTSL